MILHGDGRTWSRYFMTGGPRLYSVFGNSDGDVFAVGEQGLLLRLVVGRLLENLPRVTTSSLYAVGALGVRQGLAVGAGGITLRWDGTAWKTVSEGESTHILSMATIGSDEQWLVGESGLVLRGSGGRFKRSQARRSMRCGGSGRALVMTSGSSVTLAPSCTLVTSAWT